MTDDLQVTHGRDAIGQVWGGEGRQDRGMCEIWLMKKRLFGFEVTSWSYEIPLLFSSFEGKHGIHSCLAYLYNLSFFFLLFFDNLLFHLYFLSLFFPFFFQIQLCNFLVQPFSFYFFNSLNLTFSSTFTFFFFFFIFLFSKCNCGGFELAPP